jgi:hypothetical protein
MVRRRPGSRGAPEGVALRGSEGYDPRGECSQGCYMEDIAAIDGLVASLRAAADITKAIKDGDPGEYRSKLFGLTREIMSAASCALAVQSEQIDLVRSKRELEEELARLKAWNAEKYRYELQSVGPGANAYVPKQSMRGIEPMHWLCADCFQTGKRRFLNESHSDLHFLYYKCGECSYKIRIRKTPPGQPIAVTDYDPVAG